MKYKFPDKFYWGASCSSHQWEGGLENDWTEWERENAARLAKEASGQLTDWRKERFPEAFVPDNYISGKSCDYYSLFREDHVLAKELGYNALRMSIAWERVEPQSGKFDQQALDHYVDEIESIRQNGMEPFVTLWHWPIPLWLRDIGGWEHPQIVHYFERYVEQVVKRLRNKVKYWITINEPWVYVALHYYQGERPPAKKNLLAAWHVYEKLAEAHINSYDIIKANNVDSRIGVAKNVIDFEAYRGRWHNQLLKMGADWLVNYKYLDRIAEKMDFIGLNHYFHSRVAEGFDKNENKRTSDLGWELYPESIYNVIMELDKRYKRPIIITENGLADADDKHRVWFIEETLKNVHRAIADGADVFGYLHWSFMDNFEWTAGYWPQFGLVHVDRQTLVRTPRPSAYRYKKICQDNGF